MNPVPFTTLAAAMDFVVGDRNYPLSELFMKGGFIMWPLLLLSIAGVVVLVMCCFSTRASAVLPTKLVEQAESFIRKRDYTGLSILCKNGDSCYARVMLTVANFMLRNPSAQFEEVREIASAEGGRLAGFLSRQISWLSDIGAVAPMLGLLGTVVGMMKTFFEIANGDFSGGKQRIDMAGGVAEALITTAGGLMLGIPAILAGILTQLALYSVNLRIMGKSNQPINANNYDLLISSRNVKVLSLENPIFVVGIAVVLTIAVLYWFFGTELGASLRATGSNPNMSRAQGINTNFTKVLGLMLSNGLVALSSALLAQYQGFADVNMGRGAIVIGLAAVIIGEVIFGKVFRNFALKMLAVAIGAILYYLVYQVVIWLGLNTDDMKLITALIVAAFLAIPYWKGKYAHVKVPAGSANAGAKTGGDQDA